MTHANAIALKITNIATNKSAINNLLSSRIMRKQLAFYTSMKIRNYRNRNIFASILVIINIGLLVL